MKAFFSFLARWVIPVLGLIALSLVIWFVGPLIAIGGFEPLASATVRWVIIILLFAVWIGWRVLRLIQARRNAAKVMQGLVAVAPTPPPWPPAKSWPPSSSAWTRPWPCSSAPSSAAMSGATCMSCPGT